MVVLILAFAGFFAVSTITAVLLAMAGQSSRWEEEYWKRIARDNELAATINQLTVELGRAPTTVEIWEASPPSWMGEE